MNPAVTTKPSLLGLTDDQLAMRLGEAGRQRYLENFRFHHFRERFLKAAGLG